MSTINQLPASCRLYTGRGAWRFGYDSEGGDNQSLTWDVPVADLIEFRTKVLFTPETIVFDPGPPEVSITRIVPLICPMDPSLLALDIQGGDLQPNQTANASGPWMDTAGVWGPRASDPPFPQARITVRFGRPKYQTTGPTAFMEVSEEETSDRRTIPNHAYELIDDADSFVERLSADVAIPAGTSRFRFSWVKLTAAQLAVAQGIFEPLMDTVNDAEVVLPLIGITCPPGTLHMLSKSTSVKLDTGGSIDASLTASLARFPGGWNRFVASAPGFEGILLRANPRPIAEADFSPLFGYA